MTIGRTPIALLAGVALVAAGLLAPPVTRAEEPAPAAEAVDARAARKAARDARRAARPQIDGAAVYRATCDRCHNARTVEELAPERWEMVVTHMQVRGNLPQRDVDALLRWMMPTPGGDPIAEAKALFPDLPVVAEQCTRCHGVDRLTASTEAGKDAAWWEGTLRRMIGYGARLTPQQQAELAAALVEHGTDPAERSE